MCSFCCFLFYIGAHGYDRPPLGGTLSVCKTSQRLRGLENTSNDILVSTEWARFELWVNCPFNPLSAACKVLTARGCALFLFRCLIFLFHPGEVQVMGNFHAHASYCICTAGTSSAGRHTTWGTHVDPLLHAGQYRMNAAAGGAECFCCSSSYVSSGWLIKNIARYHSYFMGHLQNELSARIRLCQPVCTRVRACAHLPASVFCFKKTKTKKNSQ